MTGRKKATLKRPRKRIARFSRRAEASPRGGPRPMPMTTNAAVFQNERWNRALPMRVA